MKWCCDRCDGGMLMGSGAELDFPRTIFDGIINWRQRVLINHFYSTFAAGDCVLPVHSLFCIFSVSRKINVF